MPADRLALNYRPSQLTGWPPTYRGPGAPTVGATLGGHQTVRDFTVDGTAYRIALLLSDPCYEVVPTDPTVAFRDTLAAAFGAYYTFDYRYGLPGRDRFSVESYSVFADISDTGLGGVSVNYGIDLYVVYDGRYDATLRWIQVVNWSGSRTSGSYVDNSDRANPFYTIGGPTSINGTDVVNFVDTPQVGLLVGLGNGGGALSDVFRAETFLVRDTGRRDATGRTVVDVLAGLRYGWHVEVVSPG
jgi:hypothetical protein